MRWSVSLIYKSGCGIISAAGSLCLIPLWLMPDVLECFAVSPVDPLMLSQGIETTLWLIPCGMEKSVRRRDGI